MQLLLFADPKPLVEQLGAEFFRHAPEHPGVYLMRDASDAVLYVGKAKNLRQRLNSYRVANPERLRRRHLRLLRAVARIELRQCPTEASALETEAQLLRNLRPKFNQAGTWIGPRRFLCWRVHATSLELTVTTAVEPGWSFAGPFGASVFAVYGALVRLLWTMLNRERGIESMPCGWFNRRNLNEIKLCDASEDKSGLSCASDMLTKITRGDLKHFQEWICKELSSHTSQFQRLVLELDQEIIADFFGH